MLSLLLLNQIKAPLIWCLSYSRNSYFNFQNKHCRHSMTKYNNNIVIQIEIYHKNLKNNEKIKTIQCINVSKHSLSADSSRRLVEIRGNQVYKERTDPPSGISLYFEFYYRFGPFFWLIFYKTCSYLIETSLKYCFPLSRSLLILLQKSSIFRFRR